MKVKNIAKALITLAVCSCSTFNAEQTKFTSSGSIVISKVVPLDAELLVNEKLDLNNFKDMNQLLGYFPPSEEYSPAFNETWLEINSRNNTAKLMQGDLEVDKFKIEGLELTKPGYYFITSKEENPVWHAPASYFLSRGLAVPQDSTRSGAYGDMAVFTTGSLVLHDAPVWSPEVGGLKLKGSKLAKVFSSLPLGGQIIVK